MVYNPATDFVGLWRNNAGQVSKVEMPGLDYVVDALARAGLITLSVSATAPVANQSTTAWLQTAVPSYSAEGVLYLWNPATSAYAPASQALLFAMLQTAANQNGVSWYKGAALPANTVGNNGDFFILTIEPGGIYGPKTLGAWPATPLPGTTDLISSQTFDLTFGNTEGSIIYRGPATWGVLPIGTDDQVLISIGGVPAWFGVSALLDTLFGSAVGDILCRNASGWGAVPPGAATNVLTSNGAGALPSYAAPANQFPSGTVMLFQQTSAPTGWTKLTALNDYGLRVTSGAVGTTAGTPFSTVFAQTAVGNTTITQATMPSHGHGYVSPALGVGTGTSPNYFDSSTQAGNTNSTGADGAHTHSVSLQLAYVDVIMASKN